MNIIDYTKIIMPKFVYTVIILLSILPVEILGQRLASPKTFVNINTGVSANVVYYSLCQDSTGMIWLGTNAGLCGYDGYNVHRHFEAGSENNTHINCLMLNGDLLYAGTDAGVLVYDTTTGEYVPHGISFPTDVRSIESDGGDLWVGSLKGLYRYDSSNGQLHDMTTGLPHSAVYATELTRSGELYVGTYNGLCRYNQEQDRFDVVPIDVGAQKSNLFVNALADDSRRSCLWVGTEGALFKYNYNDGKVVKLSQFNGQSVKSLALDETGNLVAGTDNGLFIYSERHIEHYQHDSRITTSLSNNVVWCVMVDRDGNLWAGTESGLSESVNCNDFMAIPLYQLTGSSDGNRFYSIFRDSRGYLWLGGTNGIIRCSRRGQSKWYMMGSKEYPLRHNRVRSICEDNKYDLWIATDGGINRYDYIKEQFVNYEVTDSSNTYNANWAYGIEEDEQGRMWVCSYLGGLFAVNRDKLVASAGGLCMADINLNSTNGLPNDLINQLVLLHDGSKWVSFYKSGVLASIGKDNNLKIIDLFDNSNSHVQYIVPDKRGEGLWCGYLNGFAHVASDGSVLKRKVFPVSDDVDVFAMEIVEHDLWISTSQGIWVMNLQSDSIRHIRLPEQSYTSLYYDRAIDKMLIGGYEELLVVDPTITERHEEIREINMTAVYVNDMPYESEQRVNVGRLDGLQLSHKQNRVTLEFSDFDYKLNNRKGFEYRIRGVFDEWIFLPPGENRISISDMEHGEYVVEIRPADSMSDYVKTFGINISPAWYNSWWAMVIYAVLGILFALWLINFFRLRLRLRMWRIRSEKTIEMANSRMEFLTNISHELKTPLSMIIGPLSKMLNEEKNPTMRRNLDIIQQNALKINSLIHRALEMNRMDDNPDNLLIYSQIEMVSFCRSIFDTYRDGFPTKQFVFDSSADSIMVNADVVKIESVLNNVLSNACKYSDDGAMIKLSVALNGNDAVVTVADNGVGIPEDELPFIFQRLYQSSATKGVKDGTGIGLYLAKTYVEMHHGSIQVKSKLGEGSVFTIIIPIGDVEDNACEWQQAEDDTRDGKQNILIVEDNTVIAAFIRDILKDDYHCVVANNGKVGLAACSSVRPDLIIADMMMPVMNGIEMCRRIKRNKHLAVVPIILLTAKDDSLTEAESIEVGIDAFMSKPFEAGMLVARVKQLLKSKEVMRNHLRVEEITAVKTQAVESSDEKMLAEITKVIEDNISDPEMNVGYVCEKTGLSSKQLYRMLKSYVGIPPVDYIRQIRMKKAAMLLKQHKFTVSEVMYMVGFSSTSYFSKCFAAQFGCSPRQYAEKHSSLND